MIYKVPMNDEQFQALLEVLDTDEEFIRKHLVILAGDFNYARLEDRQWSMEDES